MHAVIGILFSIVKKITTPKATTGAMQSSRIGVLL
jgi:hypothetical protein